jgi:hypothetical protein
VFGENTSRLSQEALDFLDKKGIMEKIDKYNIIRIFFYHKKPLYIPYYVQDKSFVVEVVRQYKSWLHQFYDKKKKQFIMLP